MLQIAIDFYYKETNRFYSEMRCKRYYFTRFNGAAMQHFAIPAPLSHKEVLIPHNGIDIDVRPA